MKINRFRGSALKREQRRRESSAPFARVKDIDRLHGINGRDLILYTHPTKGYRSRTWVRGVPTFASKNDMASRIFGNLARVIAEQK